MFPSRPCAVAPFLLREVQAVAGLLEWFGEFTELVIGDEAFLVSDLFRAADDLAGPCLEDADVVGGVGHRVDGAGVEPDVAVIELGDLELAALEVLLVDGGDLDLVASARLNVLGDLDDIVVVEVEADHGEVRLRLGWLLFD